MKRNLKPAAYWFNCLDNNRMLGLLQALPKEAAAPFLRAFAKGSKETSMPVNKRRLMQYWNRQYRLGRLPFAV